MKLRYIFLTIICILLISSTPVNAGEIEGTWFFKDTRPRFNTPADGTESSDISYLVNTSNYPKGFNDDDIATWKKTLANGGFGKEWRFKQIWYRSTNTYCMDPGADTPAYFRLLYKIDMGENGEIIRNSVNSDEQNKLIEADGYTPKTTVTVEGNEKDAVQYFKESEISKVDGIDDGKNGTASDDNMRVDALMHIFADNYVYYNVKDGVKTRSESDIIDTIHKIAINRDIFQWGIYNTINPFGITEGKEGEKSQWAFKDDSSNTKAHSIYANARSYASRAQWIREKLGAGFKANINTSEVQYAENQIGPFIINNYFPVSDDSDGYSGCFGEALTIELINPTTGESILVFESEHNEITTNEVSGYTNYYINTRLEGKESLINFINGDLYSNSGSYQRTFYIDVNKVKDKYNLGLEELKQFTQISITFSENFAEKDNSWLRIGDAGIQVTTQTYQDTIYGQATFRPYTVTEEIKSTPPITIALSKIDGEAYPQKYLSAEFEMAVYDSYGYDYTDYSVTLNDTTLESSKFTVNSNNNFIKIQGIGNTSGTVPDMLHVRFKETKPAEGYKPYTEDIVLRFIRDGENWKCEEVRLGERLNGWDYMRKTLTNGVYEAGENVSYAADSSGAYLTVRNYPEEKISFRIKKVDENGNPINGSMDDVTFGYYLYDENFNTVLFETNNTGTLPGGMYKYVPTGNASGDEIEFTYINSTSNTYYVVLQEQESSKYIKEGPIALKYQVNDKGEYVYIGRYRAEWINADGKWSIKQLDSTNVNFDTNTLTLTIKNMPKVGLSFKIKKVDKYDTTKAIKDATFDVLLSYDGTNGISQGSINTNSSGEASVNIKDIKMSDGSNPVNGSKVYIILQETGVPDGYEPISNIMIEFVYNGSEWTRSNGTIQTDVTYTSGTLEIKETPQNLEFTIWKTDKANNPVNGINFQYTLAKFNAGTGILEIIPAVEYRSSVRDTFISDSTVAGLENNYYEFTSTGGDDVIKITNMPNKIITAGEAYVIVQELESANYKGIEPMVLKFTKNVNNKWSLEEVSKATWVNGTGWIIVSDASGFTKFPEDEVKLTGSTIQVKNEKIDGVTFKLIKKDSVTKNPVANVEFTVKVDGVQQEGLFKTDSNGEINISFNTTNTKVECVLHENELAWYKAFGYDIKMIFEKDSSGKWKCTEMYKVEAVTETPINESTKGFGNEGDYVIYHHDEGTTITGTLYLYNDPNFYINLNKMDKFGAVVPGAVFKYAVYTDTDGDTYLDYISNDKYTLMLDGVVNTDTDTDSAFRKITIIKNTHNIEILNLHDSNIKNNVFYVYFEETEAPLGYQKLANGVIVKFEKDTSGEWKSSAYEAVWETKDSIWRCRVGNQYPDSTNNVSYEDTTNNLKITNTFVDGFSFKVIKKDKNTNGPMQNVNFRLVDGTTYTTVSDGTVVISIQDTDGNGEETVYLHEDTPLGYKALGYALKLDFKKDSAGNWNCVKLSKVTASGTEEITDPGDIDFDGNTLELTVLNEKIVVPQISLNISKTNEDKTQSLSGAEFKLTQKQAGASTILGTYTVNGSKTITLSPSGYDDITIQVEEITAPTGYEKLSGTVELNFKYNTSTGVWEGTNTADITYTSNRADVTIKNKLRYTDINLTLKKVDSSGNSLSGAKFDVSVSNGTANCGSSVTIGSKAIKITPNNSNDVTLILKEVTEPSGYKKIDTDIEIVYKWNGTKWEASSSHSNVTISGDTIKIRNDESISKDKIYGYVYLDGFSGGKITHSPNGKYDKGTDEKIAGVVVTLTGNGTTKTYTTGSDGYYEFEIERRGVEYTLSYKYDGVNYEATIVGEGSPASEVGRDNFNEDFETISHNKSNAGITLEYFKDEPSNYNPRYSGSTWKLKTLEKNLVVKDDFDMTAETSVKIEDKEQNEYQLTLLEYEEDEDGNFTPIYTDLGTEWFEDGESLDGDMIIYDYLRNNWYIYAEDDEKSQYYYHYDKDTPSSASASKRSNQYIEFEVNFGLIKRELDLSLVNDLDNVEVSINGQTTKYKYAGIPLSNSADSQPHINIGTAKSNGISYLLELTENDFLYGTGIFKEDSNWLDGNKLTDVEDLYGTKNGSKAYEETGELTINATYRVTLNNQSNTPSAINSIDYYFDTNYDNANITAYVGDKNGNKIEDCPSPTVSSSKVIIDTLEYYHMKIVPKDSIELGGFEQKYIYVVLKMRKTDNTTITGATKNTIEVKTYNTIAEIAEYSTPYDGNLPEPKDAKDLTIVSKRGHVDIDSAPGNAIYNNELYYEDDTDQAPGLTLSMDNDVRTISGFVWDDTITSKDTFGDGKYDATEDKLENIIVQLIEIKNGTDGNPYWYLWQQTRSDTSGSYSFNNIVPGDYIVRFIYGYNSSTGKYNGQDYKSTKYENYTDYKDGDWYNEFNTTINKSVAADNELIRLNSIKATSEIDKDLGEKLADISSHPYLKTYMFADTAKIKVAVADKDETETSNVIEVDGKEADNAITLTNINFGLEERPKTAIKLERHITGFRVTANDGTTIVDAKVGIDDITEGNIINFTTESIKKGLTAIGASRDERGYWRLEADIEEAIQGATLEIVYTYKVENVGEIDYISYDLEYDFENSADMGVYNSKLDGYIGIIKGNITNGNYYKYLGKYLGSTYYTADITAGDVTKVKTHVGKIEDYINNDLKFTDDGASNQSDFKSSSSSESKEILIYEENPITHVGNLTNDSITINTVVESKEDIGNIVPGGKATQEIVLESNGKLTSTGTLDFPGYIAQIKTAYWNPMGRRDCNSIPGNLKYISIPENYELDDTIGSFTTNIEPDSYWVETVEITKPTGEDKQTNTILIILITAGIAIIGAGAFAIKKYVL